MKKQINESINFQSQVFCACHMIGEKRIWPNSPFGCPENGENLEEKLKFYSWVFLFVMLKVFVIELTGTGGYCLIPCLVAKKMEGSLKKI